MPLFYRDSISDPAVGSRQEQVTPSLEQSHPEQRAWGREKHLPCAGDRLQPLELPGTSAGVVHLVELEVTRLALAQGNPVQVGAHGGLLVTFRSLPLAQAAR